MPITTKKKNKKPYNYSLINKNVKLTTNRIPSNQKPPTPPQKKRKHNNYR